MFTDHGQTAGTDQNGKTGRKSKNRESLDNTALQRFYRTFGLFAKSAFGEIIPDIRTDNPTEKPMSGTISAEAPKI